MNREQAIEHVGLAAVETVERENCEPTSRLQLEGDTTIEYSASIRCYSMQTGVYVTLSAMYYPEKEEFLASKYYPNAGENEQIEDLGLIGWKIDHYRVDGIA